MHLACHYNEVFYGREFATVCLEERKGVPIELLSGPCHCQF